MPGAGEERYRGNRKLEFNGGGVSVYEGEELRRW